MKNLREMTGVGMMDCKKALTERDGDMDKADRVPARKGSGRGREEGRPHRRRGHGLRYRHRTAWASWSRSTAETDFVGKNEKFQNFVKGVAAVVAKEDPKDLEALMAAAPTAMAVPLSRSVQEMVLVIGENIQVRRFARFAANTSTPYIHAGGKIGVLVNFKVDGGIDATEIAKDVAMQIAALESPLLG